jgi:hypothetical protein
VATALPRVGLPQAAHPAPTADYPPYAVPRLSGPTRPGLPDVTGRIHVDQFGYLPEESKWAVISDPQRGYNADDAYTPGARLEVRRRSDGHVVYDGTPRVWHNGAIHEDSGDRGWWFDFSRVTEPGEYYVFDPSTRCRSPVFRIARDVYYRIMREAVRTYYYQRLALPLQPPCADAQWAQDAALLQDRQARFVNAKDDPSTARDLAGGWMDAGDTNKYVTFLGDVIHPLLYAYRGNPAAFGDDYNIPESGNGRPDLLDEVAYELAWLVKMQDDDGGVFIKLGNVDYNGTWPISQDPRPRYYGPKSSSASLWMAGVLAHAARVYGEFEAWQPWAAELETRAQRAWTWYRANPRDERPDTGEIKSGSANRSQVDQDRMEAFVAVHLWALTGDDALHDTIRRRAPQTRQLAEGVWSPYEAGAGEALLEYTRLPQADPQLRTRILEHLARSAASPDWAPEASADLYRSWVSPNSYHWGSCSVRASYGFLALQAAEAAPDQLPRLRQRALDMLHSFHGVNPLSMTLLTNMYAEGAELSPMYLWHDRWGMSAQPRNNPPPGYVVGGPNQSFGGKSDAEQNVDWIRRQPRAKAYADFNLGWPQNSWEITENAIYYQALYIRLLANFTYPSESPRQATTREPL